RQCGNFFQEGTASLAEPAPFSGVFEHVRGDHPVIKVAAADQFAIRPAIPNEIDLLDVLHRDPMRPVFFAQRVFVAMVEHVHSKSLFLRRNRRATCTNLQAQTVALDMRQNNLLPSHDAATRWTMPLFRKISAASLKYSRT